MTMTQSRAIKPTVGRRLWYFARKSDYLGSTVPMTVVDRTKPLDAGIAYVHSDRLINISVTDQSGAIHNRTSVPLYQDGEDAPVEVGGYCVWMDYQVQQAAKEAVQAPAAHVQMIGASPAPSITIEDIESSIAGEYYLTGDELAQASQAHVKPWPVTNEDLGNLHRLTLCILRLRNGYLVMGESACVSAENFNEKRGREAARKDAVNKIWPLMGYELRSKLSQHKTSLIESHKLVDVGGTSPIQTPVEAGLNPAQSVQSSTDSPISVTGAVAQESPAQALTESSTDCHVSDRGETTWVGVDCGSGAGDSGSTSFSE